MIKDARVHRLLVLLIPLLTTINASGQDARFQYGLTVPLAMKLNLAAGSGSRRSVFGAGGMLATVRINGDDEHAFRWQQHLGVVYDQITYKVQSGDYLLAGLYNLVSEAEVLLPTRKPQLHLSVGLGIYYTFFIDAALSSNTRSAGSFYANVDSLGTTLEDNNRALMPFVSAGIVYQFGGRWQGGIKVRQMLRNGFEPDAFTTYYIGSQPMQLALSYQPTYVEASVTWFLKNVFPK